MTMKFALAHACRVGGMKQADAALHLALVTAHRPAIAPVVEKAVGMRHTAQWPLKEAQDEKLTASGLGVEREHQRKAGVVINRQARLIASVVKQGAPVSVPARTNCPFTRASEPANRLTLAVQMHAGNRNFPRKGELYPARAVPAHTSKIGTLRLAFCK